MERELHGRAMRRVGGTGVIVRGGMSRRWIDFGEMKDRKILGDFYVK